MDFNFSQRVTTAVKTSAQTMRHCSDARRNEIARWRRFRICAIVVLLSAFSSTAALATGFMFVSKCNCQTTADFTVAAKTALTQQGYAGLYVLTSTSVPRTALMKVTAGCGRCAPEITPVDSAGKSLSGSSESYLETYYTTYDGGLFGWLRGNTSSAVGKVAVPVEYQTSFVCNCEVEDMAGQVANWILQQFPTINIGALPPGTPVTLVFKDGSTAVFLKNPANATTAFSWSGRATNSKGQPISNTSGTLLNSPNPTATGAGQPTGTPIPGGLPYDWTLIGGNLCLVSAYVTSPDGSTFGSAGYLPC